MIFASAEPRLESKFQAETYHQLIQCMYRLLDRLECARLSVGETPFGSDIIKNVLKSPGLVDSRAELQQMIGLLLYIFSSAMLTKLKILPNLPNACKVREEVIDDFVDILVGHCRQKQEQQQVEEEEEGSGINKMEEILPLTGIMPVDKEGMLETLNSDC